MKKTILRYCIVLPLALFFAACDFDFHDMMRQGTDEVHFVYVLGTNSIHHLTLINGTLEYTSSVSETATSICANNKGTYLYAGRNGGVYGFGIAASGQLVGMIDTTITTIPATHSMVIAPNARDLYAGDSSTIHHMEASGTAVALQNSYPLNGNSLLMHPRGSSMYSTGTTNINRFAIDTSGTISTIETLSTGFNAELLILHPDLTHMYILARPSGNTRLYRQALNTDGSFQGSPPTDVWTNSITDPLHDAAFDITGQFLYVAIRSTLRVYPMTSTGTPSQTLSHTNPIVSIHLIPGSPQYLLGSHDDSIILWRVKTDGTLEELQIVTVGETLGEITLVSPPQINVN